nr:MAG TPA: tail protein [Caudoviricetes sp.]
MRLKSDDGSCDARTLARTGLLPAAITPTPPSASSTSFLLYNPGTERAHTVIRIVGNVGDGMLIRNLTTGQRCKIVNLTDESLLSGAHLEMDSRMGQTRIALGDSCELAFAMHDEGYIELDPCTPFERSIAISHTENSNIITSEERFLPYMAGQFLYLDGWKKIRQITDAHSAILSDKATSSGTTTVPIVTMNEIEIGGENLALTMLEVEYIPRVR